jgi:signal transduction histidine kinase
LPRQNPLRRLVLKCEMRISIQDDGVGFDVATVQRGHGLTNMQRRADAMNGDLKIQSNLGTGTKIEIVLSKSSLLSC